MGYFSNHFKAPYFIALVGIGTGGVRLPDPIAAPFGTEPDMVERYGRFTKNDYLGTHVFDELYRAVNSLRWTMGTPDWHNYDASLTPEDNDRGEGSRGYAGDLESDWNDEFTALAGFWGGGVDYPLDGERPVAYSAGYVRAVAGDAGTLNDALLRRTYSYAHATVPTILSSQVDFYAFANISEAEISTGDYEENDFDANGDDVIEAAFSLFDSGVSPTAGLAVSVALGDSALPVPNYPAPWPGNSPGGGVTADGFRGYRVYAERAIIRWDVGGGLAFVD